MSRQFDYQIFAEIQPGASVEFGEPSEMQQTMSVEREWKP